MQITIILSFCLTYSVYIHTITLFKIQNSFFFFKTEAKVFPTVSLTRIGS